MWTSGMRNQIRLVATVWTDSYDLLTGRRIFYPFGLIKKSTSYCRDETDLITHTGGPDFVTESWDPGRNTSEPFGTPAESLRNPSGTPSTPGISNSGLHGWCVPGCGDLFSFSVPAQNFFRWLPPAPPACRSVLLRSLFQSGLSLSKCASSGTFFSAKLVSFLKFTTIWDH